MSFKEHLVFLGAAMFCAFLGYIGGDDHTTMLAIVPFTFLVFGYGVELVLGELRAMRKAIEKSKNSN